MTALQLPSVATGASNGDPTMLKIHLDVPNESVGFRNMSYDYITEVWKYNYYVQKKMHHNRLYHN